jgi:hypothetical protein
VGELGSVCGVKFCTEEAGLAAVVGTELENLVSGDSPTVDACDLLPLGIEAPWALGVTDRRPVARFERHKSRVRSRTSPAMASKASE